MRLLLLAILWDAGFFVWNMVQLAFAITDGVAWLIGLYASMSVVMFTLFMYAMSALTRR